MLSYAQAHELAKAWVKVVMQDEAVILEEKTLKRPYGWVFFYESRAFLASKNIRDALHGNAPLIVDRINGELRITGTGRPLESYLADYEATLPPARMQISMPKEP